MWMRLDGKVCDKLGFRKSVVVDPVGRAEGVAFIWNEEVNLEQCWNSERIILCSLLDARGLKIGNLLACYGTPYLVEKKVFWKNIEAIVDRLIGPWMLVGNLNEIVLGNEKIGGRGIWKKKLFLREFMQNT